VYFTVKHEEPPKFFMVSTWTSLLL
jgi:hypothetical protein